MLFLSVSMKSSSTRKGLFTKDVGAYFAELVGPEQIYIATPETLYSSSD